jgi:hypothetical protein
LEGKGKPSLFLEEVEPMHFVEEEVFEVRSNLLFPMATPLSENIISR